MNINEILNVVSTPTYIFDKNRFVNEYKRLEKEFTKIYSNFLVGYSVKTNYTLDILKTVKELGGFLEVVSDFEYEIASKIIDDSKIIYNGPCKCNVISVNILSNGGKVNADSIEELVEIENICKKNNLHLNVGVRLDIDVGNDVNSRFGIKDLDKIEDFFRKSEVLTLEGIHCHITHARELNYWELRTKTMISIAKRFNDFTEIKYIDFGSNMYSDMKESLRKQYGEDIPDFKDYANIVATAMKEAFPEENVKIIIEAGTPIVASTMQLLASVKRVKEKEDVTYAILDTDQYQLGFIAQVKQLPISIYNTKEKPTPRRNVVMSGFTCIEADYLNKVDECCLDKGDYVLFENVGAYSNVMAPNFINVVPSIVMKDLDGRIKISKERTEYEDVFKRYRRN